MAVHEAAVGGRRAESQTFEVRRAAYSDHLSTLAIKMLAVSMNYAGAEARFPRDNTNNDRRCIEATLSRSIDIRRNARALNGFRRRDVYKELELTVPELSSRMDDVKVEYADVIGNNRAGHFVVLGFDEGSEERLNEQRNGIGEAVARAAGIGIERL